MRCAHLIHPLRCFSPLSVHRILPATRRAEHYSTVLYKRRRYYTMCTRRRCSTPGNMRELWASLLPMEMSGAATFFCYVSHFNLVRKSFASRLQAWRAAVQSATENALVLTVSSFATIFKGNNKKTRTVFSKKSMVCKIYGRRGIRNNNADFSQKC